jgi:hypothetical protein
MMDRLFSVLFLLGIGAGLLALAYRGYKAGEVRAGNSLWRPYTPNRWDNPIAFHFYLTLYFVGGLALCVWGLLTMVGMAPPMRLQ